MKINKLRQDPLHYTTPLRRGEHAVANQSNIDLKPISVMTSCNSDMAMTDDNHHSTAAEAESRAIEVRVTETKLRFPFLSFPGLSFYLRLFFSRHVLIAPFHNFFRLSYYRVICSRCSAPYLKGVLFISPLLGDIHAHD